MMYGYGFNGEGFRGVGNCLGFGGGYMHGGLFLLAILLIATVAFLGTYLLMRKSRGNQADKAVMEALNMRLVSGEITEEEYVSKTKALK